MLTTQELQRIRAAIDDALSSVARDYGLASLKLGRITYDRSGSFRGSIEGTKAGGLSSDATRYQGHADYAAGRWPKLGDTIQWGGKPFTITGMGKGGAIYGTNEGKAYTVPRHAWDRKFGGVFDSPKFTNAALDAVGVKL